ncbi:MAG: CHASE4 domain-containing protein [Nibricoccus sp.]
MKLKTRLVLLLLLMFLASLAGVAMLQAIHRAEEQEAFAYKLLEREDLCNQVVPLLEYPVDQFVRDYSQWDDLVRFVAAPDPEWARVNIDNSLTTFRLTAAWILDAQGQVLYAAKEARVTTMPDIPAANPPLLDLLRKKRFLNCYARQGDATYAFRTAPIQPSADNQRVSPPQGWLIAITPVDADYLQHFGTLLGTKAELLAGSIPRESRPSNQITRELRDCTGQVIATIRLDYTPQTLTSDSNLQEMLLLVALAVTLITAVFFALHFWVLRPFDHITESLVTGKPDALKPLLGNRTEIGHVARLVRIHFANQRSMSETMEARAQLARDLHDGVIQSIYAAGMGVAAAQAQIDTQPEAAANQLQQIRTLLNDTIRETRSFITGLDSGSTDDQPFGAAVEALFESMSWIRRATPVIEINESVAQLLPRQSREQALQMIREALSNSLRHGQASEIKITLRHAGGNAVLSIADNGRGFALDQKKVGGHGLNNLGERANAIGARIKIDSAPGKGTCVTVEFTPTNPASP